MNSAEHDTSKLHEQLLFDEIHAESLSAVIDGESSFDGLDLADIEIRQRWSLYHLIGDALREPSAVDGVSAEFAARMSAALAREPIHGQAAEPVSSARPNKMVSGWRKAVLAWPGMAVAAAVVSVVWVAQPLFGVEQQTERVLSVAQTESPSVSASVSQAALPASDYVSAHRQMAGPVAVRQVAFTPGAD